MSIQKEKLNHLTITLNQETLVLPLWSRAMDYKEVYPVLNDKKAWKIFNRVQYDYSKIEKYYGLMQKIAMSVRSKNIDNAIKKYISNHPKSTVISFGSGLGTAFYRVDNGQIRWYDLDLPDVIELRKKLLPESDRIRYIGKSVFDYSWFDDIKHTDNGILFIANGVLMYFEETQIKELFSKLAARFPGSDICFDTHSKIAITVGNKVNLERFGINGEMKWAIRRAKKIAQWVDRIEIVDEYPMYARTPRSPSWGKEIIDKMNIVDNRKLANIFHLRFKSV